MRGWLKSTALGSSVFREDIKVLGPALHTETNASRFLSSRLTKPPSSA